MKNFLKIFLAVMVVLSAFHLQAASAAESGEKISVKVNGLVCDFCATTIKKSFKKIDAVSEVDINLTEKLLTIQVKEGQSLSDEEITEHVTDSGYNIQEIVREGNGK